MILNESWTVNLINKPKEINMSDAMEDYKKMLVDKLEGLKEDQTDVLNSSYYYFESLSRIKNEMTEIERKLYHLKIEEAQKKNERNS